MKVEIPQQLKADMPQNAFGKILSATPVVMAVVATMLAGLASSEMTRAQYDRALAAQQQSKAGDQWSFFQAKRVRGAVQQNSTDLLQVLTDIHPFNAQAVRLFTQSSNAQPGNQAEPASAKTDLLALLESPPGQQALALLEKGELPPTGPAPALDPKLTAAFAAVENMSPDPEMAATLAPVSDKMLEAALLAAGNQVQAFNAATEPVNQAIDRLEKLLAGQAALSQRAALGGAEKAGPGAAVILYRDFMAARLAYTAHRYEVEARLNQAIANLYELQVRKSNISAVRHHVRSQRFFFGMLAAQLGVIVSTLAMAARKRNLLWSLAAAAGLIAVAFAVYVYLYN
jgi:hypothetical protein